MPSAISCVRGRFSTASLAIAAVAVASVALQACGKVTEAEGKITAQADRAEPGLFTVRKDQLDHLHVVPVRRKSWSQAIHTTGTVDWDADHTTQAITQVSGPISRILADAGARVKAGDPLLYVSSPDVANAISAYRKARNHEDLTKRVSDRMKELLEHGSVARKDVESSAADYNDAVTDVQTSIQALRIFGITKEEIEQSERQGTAIAADLAVRAPISGVVVQKLVSPGQVVQAGSTACFLLSDVSTVWVQGHVFDPDLASIQLGDEVEETNPASARTFHGVVGYVGAFLDPATRTTPVRIVTSNPGGLLKKDMFVEAVIHTSGTSNFLAVPVSAVLRDDKNEPMVYVEASPGKFARRSVTVGPQQDGMAAVTNGLEEGENVVAEGAVFLQFANSIQ